MPYDYIELNRQNKRNAYSSNTKFEFFFNGLTDYKFLGHYCEIKKTLVYFVNQNWAESVDLHD